MKLGHRLTEGRPCKDTGRRQPSALPTLWSCTSSLQNCEKVNFPFVSQCMVLHYGSPSRLIDPSHTWKILALISQTSPLPSCLPPGWLQCQRKWSFEYPGNFYYLEVLLHSVQAKHSQIHPLIFTQDSFTLEMTCPPSQRSHSVIFNILILQPRHHIGCYPLDFLPDLLEALHDFLLTYLGLRDPVLQPNSTSSPSPLVLLSSCYILASPKPGWIWKPVFSMSATGTHCNWLNDGWTYGDCFLFSIIQ